MISYSSRSFKTLQPEDSNFYFSPDGITNVPRAGLTIALECPNEFKMIISECFNRGWIKPVANIRDTEYTMELLRK